MGTTDGEYSGNKISRFTGYFKEHTLYRVHTTTIGSQSTHYNDYIRSYNVCCTYVLWFYIYLGAQSFIPLPTPNVVIDGYTVSSTFSSSATLPLGTTIILVCKLTPQGLQTNYHWTCPNEPCQQTGYDGRKINNNIIAINITSTSDEGTYTCNVTAGGREASQQFQLNVNGQCLQVHITSTVCTYPW